MSANWASVVANTGAGKQFSPSPRGNFVSFEEHVMAILCTGDDGGSAAVNFMKYCTQTQITRMGGTTTRLYSVLVSWRDSMTARRRDVLAVAEKRNDLFSKKQTYQLYACRIEGSTRPNAKKTDKRVGFEAKVQAILSQDTAVDWIREVSRAQLKAMGGKPKQLCSFIVEAGNTGVVSPSFVMAAIERSDIFKDKDIDRLWAMVRRGAYTHAASPWASPTGTGVDPVPTAPPGFVLGAPTAPGHPPRPPLVSPTNLAAAVSGTSTLSGISVSSHAYQAPSPPPPPPPPPPPRPQPVPAPLNKTAVLANKFVPQALKVLNCSSISGRIDCGTIPSLNAACRALLGEILPLPHECICEGRTHNHLRDHDSALGLRRYALELRYGLSATAPLDIDKGKVVTARPEAIPDFGVRERTGQVERERLEMAVGTPDVRKAIRTPTCNLMTGEDYRTKFEALLILERDEILRLYEHFSTYRTEVHSFAPESTETTTANAQSYLYARITIPGIADAQPGLSAGDTVLIRPVEPLHLPMYQTQDREHMIFDPSRNTYVPNPMEIQGQVARVVRGRRGRQDEVVITWLSTKDEFNLQNAWKGYPSDRIRYNIRFVPRTTVIERCLTALDCCSCIPKSFLTAKTNDPPRNLPTYKDGYVPETAVDGKSINIGQYNLNDRQRAFVSLSVSRSLNPSMDIVREPTTLSGPAGVGKTRTLFAAIEQVLNLNPMNRILVCGPSHTAANVLTERLSSVLGQNEMLRLLDSDRAKETIPDNVLAYCKLDEGTGMFTLPSLAEIRKYRVIVCTCLDAHLLYRAGFTNSTQNQYSTCTYNYVETLIKKSGLQFDGELSAVKDCNFSHLFVDEAAQATEPEVLIPFSVVFDSKPDLRKVEIALIGDPKQLGPKCYSVTAANNGLSTSYLERLLQRPSEVALADSDAPERIGSMTELMQYYNEERSQTSVFLNTNYRSEPAFLMLPSSLFYFDKLKSAKGSGDPAARAEWCSKLRHLEQERTRVGIEDEVAGDVAGETPEIYRPFKQDHWPIHFRGVIGRDASVAIDNFSASNSWSNLEEANEVVSVVSTLVRNGVDPSKIGVMAAFRGQVVQIRQGLRNVDLAIVNVGTVEDYQAVERSVVVLSLTRSTPEFVSHDVKNRAGIFNMAKTSNVALTRAEYLLVIVGNPNVMAHCPIWRQALWFFERNGLWYGEPGNKGNASLSLSGEVMYSTIRPREDFSENGNIITVGTLEKVLRKTGVDIDLANMLNV